MEWSDEGKLLASGMSWNTTAGMLRHYFHNHGDVIYAEVKPDSDSYIYSDVSGCVIFSDPCVIDWILHHTHTLNGRTIQLKSAFHERPTPSHRFKIFVGLGNHFEKAHNNNLKIPMDEVRNYFEKYGNIVEILFPHQDRGFCFITFSTEEAVEYVLQTSPHRLEKSRRFMEVSRASPRGHIHSSARFMQFPQPLPPISAWNKVL